jgi:hypothetical protein
MKSGLRLLSLFCALVLSSVNAFSLDREAFTFTNYDLTAQIDPAQQRLGMRGKITLRNDSQGPQKIAVLQITSSLDWRSIKFAGKPLQYVTQPYTSDIDHTGALSEAIVTLPAPVPPKGTVELEIGYEGIITLDATRLKRIGAPETEANSSDWDQISEKFTGLRGAGYVAWYPIATDVADLSESNSMFDVLERWKMRESASKIHLTVDISMDIFIANGSELPKVFFIGVLCPATMSEHQHEVVDCAIQPSRLDTPTLVIADYKIIERQYVEVRYLLGHDVAATNFADSAEKIAPFITEWFGPQREKAKTADLPVAAATPFESGTLLLTPFANPDFKLGGLSAAHQLTHAAFLSFRPWIEEGLAHFAQALYLEQDKGRKTALEYMGQHRASLGNAETSTAIPRSEDEANHSLVNTTSEELYRSKAMYVWWMLRDMVGDAALKKALAAYKPEDDKEPSYMPRLVQAQTQRDLEWFFDDWVYRDRGLPEFKVESAFSRKTMNDTYMLTITVDNLGSVGAEVPIAIKYTGGEVTKRLEVRGKNKGVFRVEVSGEPQEAAVNDGSVPESNLTNNIFKIEPPASSSKLP